MTPTSSPPRPRHPRCRQRQRGVAAVEAAVLIPVMLVLFTFPVFLARVYWHYTVAQKAAQDAARYLSTVSRQEMRSTTLSAAASNVAAAIARTELAELAPEGSSATPIVQCDMRPCGSQAGVVPATVRVAVTFNMVDTFFGVVDSGRYGLRINADVTMNYAGI